MFQFKFHKTKKEKPKSDKDKASSQNSAQFCKLRARGQNKSFLKLFSYTNIPFHSSQGRQATGLSALKDDLQEY